MPRAASESSKALATVLLKFGGAGASASGTYVKSDFVNVLALQIDIASSLFREGKLTRANLTLALLSEGVGITGLSEQQRIKCGTSLVAAALSAQEFAEASAVSAAADVATSGAAAPLTTPWVVATGVATLASLYGVYDACSPVAEEASETTGRALDQLNRDLTDWSLQQRKLYQ